MCVCVYIYICIYTHTIIRGPLVHFSSLVFRLEIRSSLRSRSILLRKQNKSHAKRAALVRLVFLYNTMFFLCMRASRTLNVTAFAKFTYNNIYIYIYIYIYICVCMCIYIYIISIFLCTLKLDSKLHRVCDGVLSKRHEREKSSIVIVLSRRYVVFCLFVVHSYTSSHTHSLSLSLSPSLYLILPYRRLSQK